MAVSVQTYAARPHKHQYAFPYFLNSFIFKLFGDHNCEAPASIQCEILTCPALQFESACERAGRCSAPAVRPGLIIAGSMAKFVFSSDS
jgi:hypothetical protein